LEFAQRNKKEEARCTFFMTEIMTLVTENNWFCIKK